MIEIKIYKEDMCGQYIPSETIIYKTNENMRQFRIVIRKNDSVEKY